MHCVIRATSGINLPQTILASSAQSLRCWSVPSAGCLLAQLVSEATVIASRIMLAKKQMFDALRGVIRFGTLCLR
jgi:hypothetical protein